MPVETVTAPEWIDRTAAARRLGVDPRVIQKLAALGKIATRNLPCKSRYYSPHVDSLVSLIRAGVRKRPAGSPPDGRPGIQDVVGLTPDSPLKDEAAVETSA